MDSCSCIQCFSIAMVITLLVPDGARVKRPVHVFDTKHIKESEVFHKARILAVGLVLYICILSVLLGVKLLIPTNMFVPFSEWS